MLHKMKLQQEPFEKIKNGTKTVELRLYDEKRQKIQVGDVIVFSRMDAPAETLQASVTALYRFDSFQELMQAIPQEAYGYSAEETVSPDFMDAYYSQAEQLQYGVVGIAIAVLKENEVCP